MTKRMRRGSQDKDDNKEINGTMMIKKMKSESQDESDDKGEQQHRMTVCMCENMRITKIENKIYDTKPLTWN